MLENGAEVFSTSNIVVTTRDGPRVAVRWGDPGKVASVESDGSVSVCWTKSRVTNESIVTSPQPGLLSSTRPSILQGDWVRFQKDLRFRSAKFIQSGLVGVVLDVLPDTHGDLLTVRSVPIGTQEPYVFGIRSSDVELANLLPGFGLDPQPDEIPGGFRAADLVFSTKDIAVGTRTPPEPTGGVEEKEVDMSDPVLQVRRGDVGIVIGERHGNVLVRYESRLDTGEALWTNVMPNFLSRQPQLCPGRLVRLTSPVAFGDGSTMKVGRLGWMQNEDVVQIYEAPGETVRKMFKVSEEMVEIVNEQPPASEEALDNRLAELEALAKHNETSGHPRRSVSMLEQNVWSLFGYGCGVGFGFLEKDRVSILGNQTRSLALRVHLREPLDGTLNNESKVTFDHQALVFDHQRVQPYLKAIRKAARGKKRVLDIGTGPYCLLARLCLRAGAESVEAVEVSDRSVSLAMAQFQAELRGHDGLPSGSTLPAWATVNVRDVADVPEGENDSGGLRSKVEVSAAGGEGDVAMPAQQRLALFHGMSTDNSLALTGGYDMLVHEILGDFAGTEGAASVIADVFQRGLVSKNCVFVPRSSSTMLAPTAVLQPTVLETVLHRMRHHGASKPRPLVRYSARHFKKEALLAQPQALELIDFQHGPKVRQDHVLEFRTDREGDFDGVHMHLLVDLDGEESINALELHSDPDPNSKCSWNTTYVRLTDEPVHLPAGSRIVFRCCVNLESAVASYGIVVALGEVGEERDVASFEWRGG
eukprot:TRINITY_DN38155_c0_g2_i1.p1 TRINITY_DN38155_c0_g2~~TRINITY_DN38155_c0_g2_i1.p1  ORF type:complete len:758 (+),score=125.12 TRINITY_DN38155_c0_g2_i1:120-2393(+)